MKNPLHKKISAGVKAGCRKISGTVFVPDTDDWFVSGFQVADSSMTKAYDESFEKI